MNIKKEITEWMKATVQAADDREAFVQAEKQNVYDRGGIYITWSGGGNCKENRITNADTGELLAVIEDTVEALDTLWDKNENWYYDDSLYMDAWEKFPSPEPSPRWAFLVNDDPDVEAFRDFLKGDDHE